MAAASLSSAEVEELEPAAVFEDEADCMGLIFWLSGVLVGLCSQDLMSRAKFWRVAGMADCVVRGNQQGLVISPLQHRVKKFIQIQAKVIPSSVLKGLLPGSHCLRLYALEIDFGHNIHQL